AQPTSAAPRLKSCRYPVLRRSTGFAPPKNKKKEEIVWTFTTNMPPPDGVRAPRCSAKPLSVRDKCVERALAARRAEDCHLILSCFKEAREASQVTRTFHH